MLPRADWSHPPVSALQLRRSALRPQPFVEWLSNDDIADQAVPL
jgi:hypothetical protein